MQQSTSSWFHSEFSCNKVDSHQFVQILVVIGSKLSLLKLFKSPLFVGIDARLLRKCKHTQHWSKLFYIYLVVWVILNLWYFQHISIITNKFLFSTFSQANFLFLEKLLQQAERESRNILEHNVVFGCYLQSSQISFCMELFVVKWNKCIVNLLSTPMGRSLVRNGSHLLNPLLLLLLAASQENLIQFILS